MKTCILFILIMGVCCMPEVAPAQRSKAEEGRGASGPAKTAGIIDRAGGTHNKNNHGFHFENRGKLYARRVSEGPSGEWPIGSGHEYIYRSNPYVGIPGNVIQGRFTTNEEWEALPGYHFRDSAKVAFSDKPYTWPASGWPVKDASGKPVFVSNQDSYCAYADSNNSRKILRLQVNQTGYVFSQRSLRDVIFLIYDITNNSATTYDSVYYGAYLDMDVGGTAEAEYTNDIVEFDKKWNRVYFHDPPPGFSKEWAGPSGYYGFLLMQSPKVNGAERGITDFHYMLYKDDVDIDSVQFGMMSSARSLYQSSLGSRFFHVGANATDLHFDDPALYPAAGLDVIGIAGSGPYRLAPGDTLRFVTAFVAGTTLVDLDSATVHAYDLLANSFKIAQPPPAPKASSAAGDRQITITWNNAAESSRDPFTGKGNFEGYRIYKSVDRGLHWDQVDRNQSPTVGADPVPFASFDRVDGLGKDVGLQHSCVDSTVVNGFEYWYSVTAYTSPDPGGNFMETSRGSTLEDSNLVIAIPRSLAAGRIPVTATPPRQSGAGSANLVFTIQPTDVAQTGDQSYTITFAPVATVENGNLRSAIQVGADTSLARTSDRFAVVFRSAGEYAVRNLTAGTMVIPSGTYASGAPILFEGLRIVLTDTSSVADERPEEGDSLLIQPGIHVTMQPPGGIVSLGGDGVLPLQPFSYGTRYATSNGIILSLARGDTISSNRVTYQDRFTFSTLAARLSPNASSADLERIKVVPNPYIVASLYEQEFGTLRREPIRQLKFNNLPPVCSINIFTLAGDLVQTIQHNSDNGTETWNMKGSGGREIAPGVYLYLVKTDYGEKIGRFAVIK